MPYSVMTWTEKEQARKAFWAREGTPFADPRCTDDVLEAEIVTARDADAAADLRAAESLGRVHALEQERLRLRLAGESLPYGRHSEREREALGGRIRATERALEVAERAHLAVAYDARVARREYNRLIQARAAHKRDATLPTIAELAAQVASQNAYFEATGSRDRAELVVVHDPKNGWVWPGRVEPASPPAPTRTRGR